MAISLLNDKLLVAATLVDGVLEANNAANYRFQPDAGNNGVVRFALLTNDSATATEMLYYRVNTNSTDGTAASEASATVYDGIVKPQETVDISYKGTRAIKDVSIFHKAATTPIIRLVGLA